MIEWLNKIISFLDSHQSLVNLIIFSVGLVIAWVTGVFKAIRGLSEKLENRLRIKINPTTERIGTSLNNSITRFTKWFPNVNLFDYLRTSPFPELSLKFLSCTWFRPYMTQHFGKKCSLSDHYRSQLDLFVWWWCIFPECGTLFKNLTTFTRNVIY